MLDTSKLTGTEDCMNFSSFKLRHFRCSHDFLSIFKADVPYCIANGRCWPLSDRYKNFILTNFRFSGSIRLLLTQCCRSTCSNWSNSTDRFRKFPMSRALLWGD